MNTRVMDGRRAAGIVLVCLIWVAALACDFSPWLRGGYGWRWPYEIPPHPMRLVLLALVFLVYVAVGVWWSTQSRAAGLLAWAVVAGIALTLASLYVSSDHPLIKLYVLTVAGASSGWHYAAAQIVDLAATLRDWPRFMQQSALFSPHVALSPPGLVVAYYAANQVLEHFPPVSNALGDPLRAAQCHNLILMGYSNAQLSSALLGTLMPVWGGLTVLPLYGLGRRLFSERAARWSVLWWPLVPSFLMFAPSVNTFFPFLAVSVMVLLVRGLDRRQVAWVFAAGVLMSAMTFISLAFFPLILLAGLFVLGTHLAKTSLSAARGTLRWRWPLLVGLAFGLGLLTVWVIAYIAAGVSFFAIWRTAMGTHLTLDRPYWPWLILHVYDYGMFTGWPLVILAGLGIWRALVKARLRQPLSDGDVLAIAVLATLFILDVSGVMRGESGRLLLFLTPFVLPVAASVLMTERSRWPGWILTAGQVVTALVMIAFLRVMISEFKELPPAAPPAIAQTPPAAKIPSGAVFGDAFHLTAFSGAIKRQPDSSGQVQSTLILWLRWESSKQVDRPQVLSLTPIAPDGKVAADAVLRQPLDGAYQTTCWLPRSGPIRDRMEISLPKPSGEGGWWVSLSLADMETGTKMKVVRPDGERDDEIRLGPFYPTQ